MKKVILDSLTMVNFMGEKERTTNFNEVETSILGDNGLGKTRHFNAFMWLLFGKDIQDRKDYNIKTLIDGKPLEKVECEVFGIIDVDGEKIKLRRAYVEDWVKPRGQIEQVFKGHHTELYWNDVPLNIGEYQSRINAIIDDSVFKMISIPLYFPTLDWKLQREQLFQLAGTITDSEIASQKPEYKALLDKITGKSLSDFKRELASRRKKLKDELEQVQPRIDQTQKLMPENIDFKALEVEIASLDKQLEDVEKAITDKSAAIRQQYEGVQKKQNVINDLKQEQQQLLFKAKETASEAAFEANSLRRNLENNIKSLENEVGNSQRIVQQSEKELESFKKRLENKNQEIVDLRKTWHDENAKAYCGDENCHECGQLLPGEKRENAKQTFAKGKEVRLADITKNGSGFSDEVKNIEQDINNTSKCLESSENELKTKQGEIAEMKDQLARMPLTMESTIKGEDLPEYMELSTKIKNLEDTLEDGTQAIDNTELQNIRKGLSEKRDTAKSELLKRDLIAKHTTEISELKVKGKDISQQIADVEREEYTIQNFNKAKIDECERRINGLFSMVTFKLFEYTIEGNESETCIPLVGGVPFGSANTAGKVNAGLDIINALTQYYNICAPIFVDGRESVNELINTPSQIINLIVLPKQYKCNQCGHVQSTHEICETIGCKNSEFTDITPKELIIK